MPERCGTDEDIPARIRLDQVDARIYPGFGPPPVDQMPDMESERQEMLRLLDSSSEEIVTNSSQAAGERTAQRDVECALTELVEIGRGVRRGVEPRSALYVLLYTDNLTIGEIAGTMHADPRDIEISLDALVRLGWVVRREDAMDGRARFSFIGLSGY